MEQTKTGAFLRQRRKALNLTQEQLAQQLGVSNKTISKWENGLPNDYDGSFNTLSRYHRLV